MGPTVYANILPVLFGNPATFVAAVALRLFTAFAGLKAKRVNKCAPYYPVQYNPRQPWQVTGLAVPIEQHWPYPWREGAGWGLWDSWDLVCSNLRAGIPQGPPILTPQQRAVWSQITGGVVWRYLGQVVPSSVVSSRTSVGFSGARQVRPGRF